MQAAVLGGVFIGILSALPIVNVANCCCLWIVGGGVLAAYLDHQPDAPPLTIARGASLGLIAGIVGALVWLLASLALDPIVGPLQQRMAEEVLRRASDMPPEARAALEGVGERGASPLRYVLGFLFQLVIGMMFAAAGGAIGAAWLRRSADHDGPRRNVEPPPLPPQP